MICQIPFVGRTAITSSLFSIMLMLANAQAKAEEISGQVIEVLDGDTLSLLTSDDWQIHVRLASIDAPDLNQPYSDKARQTLSDLALGKRATLQVEARDLAGRSVARMFIEGLDINREMVRRGAAWVATDDAASPVHLLPVEAEAKQERRGLWAQPQKDIVPPWVWSNSKRQYLQTAVSGCAGHFGASKCPMRRLHWIVPAEQRH